MLLHLRSIYCNIVILMFAVAIPCNFACCEEPSQEATLPHLPPPTSTEAATVLEEVIGKSIDIELSTGKRWTRCELLGVISNPKTKEVSKLRIKQTNGKNILVSAKSILRVSHQTFPILERPANPEKKNASAERMERAAKKSAEERAKWTARALAKGVTPWKEVTKEEYEKAIAGQRAMIEEVQSQYSDLKLYETEYFLFTTNMPEEQAKPYIKALDDMYDLMCTMYGLKKGERVFLGKCPVYAFLTQEQFQSFEANHFQKSPPSDVYGLCHQRSDGYVLISCYRGDNPNDFGHMLVHETSHGFIFRFRTAARLPSWVNEGMAEYIGEKLVPDSEQVKLKEMSAFLRMKDQRNLGGNYFDTDKNIEGWQYGVASSMTKFLIKSNSKSYVQFICSLKEGTPWEEALTDAYKATPDQLLLHYGKSLGLPDLKP